MTSFTRYGNIALGLMLTSACQAFDEAALLRAIAEVETGTTNFSRPCRKVGAAGERSAWQIKEMVWRLYTHEPHTEASRNARLANVVATMHLKALVKKITASQVTPTPYLVALKWNAGPEAKSYATRVANLCAAYAVKTP